MKYLSVDCVANAYINFQGAMTNKSWGFLAIMKQIPEIIRPGISYSIECNDLSTFLEDLFCISNEKASYNGNKAPWYVMFSNKYLDFFQNQGNSTPNIYDVISWCYRRTAFDDNTQPHDLIVRFAKDFNLTESSLNRAFLMQSKPIEFSDDLYSEDQLKNKLSGLGVDTREKNITAIKTAVKAAPGELSRGPFVQPLYAALDTSDYLLISQSDFKELYSINAGTNITTPTESIETSSSFNVELISYLTAIRTKPFILLAGISGTGKSRIVRKLAQATDDIDRFESNIDRFKCHNPSNFCLIQVKPNWHNSMDVVGFKSNVGKDGSHYEFTPFVEFIAKAWHHPNTPFFLCLDEMNLAPVEEYFAEFLSAIESRSFGEDGEYETDAIIKPFDSFGPEVCGQMIGHLVDVTLDQDRSIETRFRTVGLTLPKNLIVMGTVNMDETTFSFSRKVLDRAMSIEMNDVDYDAFLEGTTDNDIPVLIERNSDLVERNIKAQEVKDFIDAEVVKNFLNDVNNVLDGTPFKLGYRAANEAMLYVAAAKRFGNDNIAAALDDFTLMKILSRIEGDDSKLKTINGQDLLSALESLFIGGDGMFIGLDSSKTMTKLSLMAKSLERDHFVSFWS